MGYNIYDLKYPSDQFDPDPSKKTLVVLGKLALPPRDEEYSANTCTRLWLGFDFLAQEARYRELQCHRHLS